MATVRRGEVGELRGRERLEWSGKYNSEKEERSIKRQENERIWEKKKNKKESKEHKRR